MKVTEIVDYCKSFPRRLSDPCSWLDEALQSASDWLFALTPQRFLMPRTIVIQSTEDIPVAVAEAQEALGRGASVGLPSMTGYCLGRQMPETLAGFEMSRPDRIAVNSFEQVNDLVPDLPMPLRRLLGRCWPGPLVMEIGTDQASNIPAEIFHQGTCSISVPAHPVLQELTAGSPRPLLISQDTPRITSAGEFAAKTPECELVLDSGAPVYAEPATIVRMTSAGFEHVRLGILSQQAVDLSACRIFLFVCTGNTCRSPLAEGLFRNLIAKRLQCAESELTKHGILIQSAGLAAAAGSPASNESVVILSKRGVDISTHASQPLTEGLLEMSDHIFTMTRSHFDAIVRYRPDLAEKVGVLRPDGSDVVDPIGGGTAEYQRCEREIEESLMAIIANHFPQE